jgi:hypothetical protein
MAIAGTFVREKVTGVPSLRKGEGGEDDAERFGGREPA